MRKRVLVPVANGSEEIETVGIADTLRRAGAEVILASVQDFEITASRGVRLKADSLLEECRDIVFDLIVIPGGMPGAESLRDSSLLSSMLKDQAGSGRLYAAICAAPVVVLQYHGLLEGKKATAHPALAHQLVNQEAARERTVIDGNCITSQGPGTVLEFSILLIEMLFGPDKAARVAAAMLV